MGLRNRIGKTASAATTLMLATALTALGAVGARAGCLDDIKSRGLITAGMGIMGMKPYVWKDGNQVKGFEWEMFQELAKRLGVPKAEYAVTEWSSLIPGLKSQKWDIVMSSMSVTQERIQGAGITFSRPYLIQYDVLVVNSGSEIKTLADLKGKTIGATLGSMESINSHRLVDSGAAARVADFNGMAEPFLALANKQVDAVMADQLTYAVQKQGLSGLTAVGDPIPYQPKLGWEAQEAKADYIQGSAAVAIRPECSDLKAAIDNALLQMEADGTRQRIFRTYGIWDATQQNLVKS